MKDKDCSTAANWNYLAISLVCVAVLTIMVLYMPELKEFDTGLLREIRSFLAPYPDYTPAFVNEFGRDNYMLWPQIAAGSVLVSHHKYFKAFLLIFFTQGAFFITDLINRFVCSENTGINQDYTFLSISSSTAMCFYGILAYLVFHYVKNDFWRYFLAIVFGLFIFLVSLSCLWVGMNFPAGVIGGLFLGFMLVNLYIILVKVFRY